MASVETLYGSVAQTLFEQLRHIRLAAFDVDGVFSDGCIYLGNAGEELKAFNTLDGYGIKAIMKMGIEVAVITGRNSQIVNDRMTNLGVNHIIQGQEEKRCALSKLQHDLGIASYETLAVGDDMPDVGMFEISGVSVAVINAHPYVKRQAHYQTQLQGGHGAVREVCDLLLQAHGKLDWIHGSST